MHHAGGGARKCQAVVLSLTLKMSPAINCFSGRGEIDCLDKYMGSIRRLPVCVWVCGVCVCVYERVCVCVCVCVFV